MTDIHEAASSFYHLSERFCDAVEKKSVSVENAAEWLFLLMELYTKAMALPEVEHDDESISYESITIPQPAIECPSAYWEIYDPFHLEEPVCGDLKDDLQDIYRDLCSGIKAFKAGNVCNAIWEWKFGLNNHLGQHAVDAIRALHSIRTDM